MIEIRHVLCAVDFSECSRQALHHAAAVARWYAAWLSVLHVYPASRPPLALPEPALPPADRADLVAQLRAFVPAPVRSHLPVELLALEGNVADEILAEAEHADLLVVGTHGRSGFEHLVLGSVAETVVQKAACPVMTVPRAAPDATNAVPVLFHRIVAGVDYSEASLDALEYAVSLAEDADAHLTVLRVVDIAPQRAERTRLHDLVPDAVRRCCHVDERVEPGRPGDEILEVAAEESAGLIVIGAQGHRVVDRMLYGSTARHVVRQAVCPVLTVRAQAQERARDWMSWMDGGCHEGS